MCNSMFDHHHNTSHTSILRVSWLGEEKISVSGTDPFPFVTKMLSPRWNLWSSFDRNLKKKSWEFGKMKLWVESPKQLIYISTYHFSPFECCASNHERDLEGESASYELLAEVILASIAAAAWRQNHRVKFLLSLIHMWLIVGEWIHGEWNTRFGSKQFILAMALNMWKGRFSKILVKPCRNEPTLTLLILELSWNLGPYIIIHPQFQVLHPIDFSV